MRMRTRLGRLLPLVALAAGACTGGGSAGPAQSGDGDTVDLGNTQLIAALKPFDSCDDELAYLKEQALAVVGPYGINGLGPVGYRATGLAEDTASGGPTAGAPSTTAPTTDAASPDSGTSAADEAAGFSGTNVPSSRPTASASSPSPATRCTWWTRRGPNRCWSARWPSPTTRATAGASSSTVIGRCS